MLTRRGFLGSGGIGMLALSAGCQPPGFRRPVYGEEVPTGTQGLARKARHRDRKHQLLGYPINMNTPSDEFFAWRSELLRAGIDGFAFNNVGNPFHRSPIPFNTHDLERETVLHFGKLFDFPESDTWGFLSHSGTDSNMHGMYMGRTILQARTGRPPMAYFTREAHYSVQILRDLLGLEGVTVATLPDGGMDPNDLAQKLFENAEFPALVVATLGTTFKGAIDNIDRVREKLPAEESYLHLDAALFGGYLPFTRHADVVAHRAENESGPGRYDSIAVSCHKFFGFPSPAGLFVTRRGLYEEFNGWFSRIHNPEYIHHVPGTITCSRDAVKPAEFHYFTRPAAKERQIQDAERMLDNTGYLLDEMRTHFPQLSPTRANRLSNTIYFRSPGVAIINKYSLAAMHLEVDDGVDDWAHVVVMPHVSRDVLAEFLTDLDREEMG